MNRLLRSIPAPWRRLFCLLGIGLASGPTLRADDALPVALPATRYDNLAAHWPFAPPTAVAQVPVAPPAPPAPPWSDKLTVTSVVQMGKTFIVTVVDQDSSRRYSVSSDKVNSECNLQVESVRWVEKGEPLDKFVVKIRKGTEVAPVRYDPGTVGSATPIMAGPGIPGAIRPAAPLNNAPLPYRPPPPPPVPVSVNPPMGQQPGGAGRRVIRPNPGQPANPGGPTLPGAAVPNNAPLRSNPALNPTPDPDDDDD